ncbi:MAG: hypothetical protein ACLS43_07035 [Evtepia gabavorous]
MKLRSRPPERTFLGQLLEVSGGCLAQLGGEPGVELIVGLL